MFNKIFSWFENRLNPYPEGNPTTPKKAYCVLFGLALKE